MIKILNRLIFINQVVTLIPQCVTFPWTREAAYYQHTRANYQLQLFCHLITPQQSSPELPTPCEILVMWHRQVLLLLLIMMILQHNLIMLKQGFHKIPIRKDHFFFTIKENKTKWSPPPPFMFTWLQGEINCGSSSQADFTQNYFLGKRSLYENKISA